MRCPKCEVASLDLRGREGSPSGGLDEQLGDGVLACRRCGGVWLDHTQVALVSRMLNSADSARRDRLLAEWGERFELAIGTRASKENQSES